MLSAFDILGFGFPPSLPSLLVSCDPEPDRVVSDGGTDPTEPPACCPELFEEELLLPAPLPEALDDEEEATVPRAPAPEADADGATEDISL